MHGADIGDDTHGGLGQVTQERYFSGHIKAHLQHGPLVTGTQAQQGEGQADFVIQIALVFEGVIALAKHFGHQFFGGRFADAAGYSDYAHVELFPPKAGDGLQRFQAVFHPQQERDLGQARILRKLPGAEIDDRIRQIDILLYDGGLGSLFKGVFDECMPVDAFPGSAKNRLAGIACLELIEASLMIKEAPATRAPVRASNTSANVSTLFSYFLLLPSSSWRMASGGRLVSWTQAINKSLNTGAATIEP